MCTRRGPGSGEARGRNRKASQARASDQPTLVDRDPDIALYQCVRQDPKRLAIYGLAHSIHCAVVCLLEMLRHVDVFMAKISPRTGRVPLSTQMAARQMFQEDQSVLPAAIIKEVGIHPPGEFVKLKSVEHAVVVRRTANASTPVAAAITDRSGMPVMSPVLRDTSKPELSIASTISSEKGSTVLRMAPERLYGLPD